MDCDFKESDQQDMRGVLQRIDLVGKLQPCTGCGELPNFHRGEGRKMPDGVALERQIWCQCKCGRQPAITYKLTWIFEELAGGNIEFSWNRQENSRRTAESMIKAAINWNDKQGKPVEPLSKEKII